MSNGYFIRANLATDDGYLMVRECWGSYAPDDRRTVEVTDGDVRLFVTPEELAALIAQVRLSQAELSHVTAEGTHRRESTVTTDEVCPLTDQPTRGPSVLQNPVSRGGSGSHVPPCTRLRLSGKE